MKILIIVLIIFTSEIYTQWTLDAIIPYNNHSPNIQQICVIDSTTSWAMGYIAVNFNYYSPFFAKKTIHGWNYLNTNLDSAVRAFSFTAIDSLNIWLGTNHPSNIYYSSNGGINWNLQYHVDDTGHVVGITFCKQNNNIGYAFCHLALNTFWNGVCVLKTTNRGLNWTRWNFEYYGYSCADKSISVVDSNHAWFGADDLLSGTSKIINTTNGGLTWNITDISAGNDAPFTIQFSNDNQTGLFASQTNPTAWFYRTTNAGLNWNIVYTTSYYYSKTMVWIPGTSNIYGNSEFALVRSINSGLSWSTMTGGPGTNLKSMDAVKINNNTIYALAVTYDRRVYKLLDSVRVIGIESTGTEIPSDYNLYQNYPNPFNPSTTINFDLPKNSIISIKVYDITGKLVTVLSDYEFKNAGSYKVTWNAENFSSGIYFYRIEADNFMDSKKMVFVK